jgi:hypothetical protein
VRALFAIAGNDLLRWRRSPLVMAALVAVLTASATLQPVALVTQDQGPLAARFARIITEDSEASAGRRSGGDSS